MSLTAVTAATASAATRHLAAATRLYLSGLAYEVGASREISTLQEMTGKPRLLETLTTLGLWQFRQTSLAPAALAGASIARTLKAAKLEGPAVDCLIYATSTFGEERFIAKDVNDLLCDLDMSRAYPVGITMSQCGNAITGLRVAASMLRAGECQTVVVVAVDTVGPGGSRVVPPEVSVYSDAASSFVVSTVPGEFELLAVRNHMIPLSYVHTPYEDLARYLRLSAQGLKESCAQTLLAVEKRPSDFRWLFANNYNSSVSRFFSLQTGFGLEQIYTGNLARHAHAYASDCLMNLRDCNHDQAVSSGDLLLLLASGFNLWATAALMKT